MRKHSIVLRLKGSFCVMKRLVFTFPTFLDGEPSLSTPMSTPGLYFHLPTFSDHGGRRTAGRETPPGVGGGRWPARRRELERHATVARARDATRHRAGARGASADTGARRRSEPAVAAAGYAVSRAPLRGAVKPGRAVTGCVAPLLFRGNCR